MNANDVIESYVADVAAKLPRKQRNDVAFELRSLLAEELQGKAEAAGSAADAAMATELVNAFGRPAEVAARYQPTLTVIDPADGCIFFAWTALDGPATLSPASDAMFKMALTLIIGITLVTRAVQLSRGIRPAPN